MNNWIAPETQLLPDFILGGAMKCGTSTLHQILNKHPKIFIPKKEIGFFDIDNMLEHSDFNFYHEHNWITQSMDKNSKLMWEWYQEKFKDQKAFLKGEDSTTYLASRIASKRISLQKKEIKLIFLLRQPSLRAYSNYSHLLRTGRATYSFENTIQFNPYQIINRSLYKEQLATFYKYIPKERIKVILFEDLIQETELTIKEVSTFLGIDYEKFPDDVLKIHANKGKSPKNSSLQAKKNLLFRNFGNTLYSNSLPFTAPPIKKSIPLFARALNKLHSKINPSISIPSKINQGTKLFLDNYFYKELQGIDELVGKDILSKWFPEKFRANKNSNKLAHK